MLLWGWCPVCGLRDEPDEMEESKKETEREIEDKKVEK